MLKFNFPLFARILVLATLIVMGGIFNTASAAADWHDLEVYNNTGYTIRELYITVRGMPGLMYGDLLGSNILRDGEHFTTRYDANYQYYEIKIVLSDGSVHQWRGDSALNFRGSTMLVLSNNGDGTFRAKVD